MNGAAHALLVLLAALAFGCQTRSSAFVTGGDGSLGEPQRRDGGRLADAADAEALADAGADLIPSGDAGDACVARPETCNGLDDDCDGVIDDGFAFNTDPLHCGRCGNACTFGNARAACSLGKCRLDACAAGFVDLDRLEVNGCECRLSNGGVELCDGEDNDCDGVVDDGFDLATSVEHCGLCGRTCRFEHAAPTCAAGSCVMGTCEAGFVDLDKSPRNGCEYACAATNGGIEVCDGKDNDCDGETDESDPRAGMRCFPDGMVGCDVGAGSCAGLCAFGTFACLPGGLVCQNAVLPKQDLCDGQDNDCDGQADEEFDLANDPRWCGACNRVCDLPNAVNGCTAGACVVRQCRGGWVDLDGAPANGCEYACTADGPEVCDGKDNDCDGKLDAEDGDLLHPMVNFCTQTGECGKGPGGSTRFAEATYPVCTKAPGSTRPDWICNYPETAQLFAPNQVLGQETWCDALDNDCDGATDEHLVPALGSDCTDNGVGECRKTGTLRCQPDRTLGPTCDVSAAVAHTPVHEVCDGKDNDCDGVVDESWSTVAGLGLPTCGGADCRGVEDELVHVTIAGQDYWIFQHEASRPDATTMAQGTEEHRACSRAAGGVRPWTLVNRAQAAAACAGAGMRLCRTTRAGGCGSGEITADEWGLACSAGLICGSAPQSYPYGCGYDAAACNGLDRALGAPAGSGAHAACMTGDLDVNGAGIEAVYDMSGNVAEWTEDCRGTLADGTGRKIFTLRGGSFNNVAQSLRCDFMSLVVAENFSFTDTGFRCCSSCPPGQADCGGQCVALGSDANNCGACGVTCAGGTCANGVCR